MPCYDSRDDDDRKLTKERLDLATRVACELSKHLQKLESGEKHFYLSQETKNWIKEHKRVDKCRM